MSADTFVLLALVASAVAFLANILLWVPILGKAFYLIGKILRIVGIAVGLLDIYAVLVFLEVVASPI